MNLFKQRKWGKPQRNLAFIRSSSIPYFWGEENYFLSDFFLPGDPPDQFNIAADSSGESQREFAHGWWGFAGTFLGVHIVASLQCKPASKNGTDT